MTEPVPIVASVNKLNTIGGSGTASASEAAGNAADWRSAHGNPSGFSEVAHPPLKVVICCSSRSGLSLAGPCQRAMVCTSVAKGSFRPSPKSIWLSPWGSCPTSKRASKLPMPSSPTIAPSAQNPETPTASLFRSSTPQPLMQNSG